MSTATPMAVTLVNQVNCFDPIIVVRTRNKFCHSLPRLFIPGLDLPKSNVAWLKRLKSEYKRVEGRDPRRHVSLDEIVQVFSLVGRTLISFCGPKVAYIIDFVAEPPHRSCSVAAVHRTLIGLLTGRASLATLWQRHLCDRVAQN